MTAPPLIHGPDADTSPGRGVAAAHVCRGVVAVLLVAVAGLVLLALAPRLVGFDGHVVVSGSMEPRLAPGDVVLTRPVSPQDLRPGQVLLFPDPDRADRLVLHRLVSFDDRGDLVTRGDANQSDDAAHVPASSVIGEARLSVPYVGLPAHWRLTGQWIELGLLAAVLAAATVLTLGGGAGPADLAAADRFGGLLGPDRQSPPPAAPHAPAGDRCAGLMPRAAADEVS